MPSLAGSDCGQRSHVTTPPKVERLGEPKRWRGRGPIVAQTSPATNWRPCFQTGMCESLDEKRACGVTRGAPGVAAQSHGRGGEGKSYAGVAVAVAVAVAAAVELPTPGVAVPGWD